MLSGDDKASAAEIALVGDVSKKSSSQLNVMTDKNPRIMNDFILFDFINDCYHVKWHFI